MEISLSTGGTPTAAEPPVQVSVASGSPEVDLERLRAVLHPEPVPSQRVKEDGFVSSELRPASVLFPIVPRENGIFVLLTRRTSHLRHHPGQISFPGGRVEAEDCTPVHTALREAREEIGLQQQHVEVIGYLPDYCTSTGFRITPVVGIVTPPFELNLDEDEVAGVFEVPLSFLLDPANHQEHSMVYAGRLRKFHAMPYHDHDIWGATAGMIFSLYQALSR